MRSSTALAALALAGAASAQVPLQLQLVTGGVPEPVAIAYRPGDVDDLFVASKAGQVLRIRNGQLQATPYLDVSGLVSQGFERGLLGLAFHPDYPAVKAVFAAYTDLAGDTVVARWSEDPADPTRVLPGPGTVVLGPVAQPGVDHNGGCLAFGPDGMLYVGMGDGSSPYDSGPGHLPDGNAQALGTLLGKILRLDVDAPFPHVPADNPFVGVAGARPEIWALGLRNPWRFSFDRLTGELFVGDVGEDAEEEVSVLPPGVGGLNLGWRCLEGVTCTGLSGCACSDATLLAPAHVYGHAFGLCSVTGGQRYRGCAIPGLDGRYFFADFCTGTIWSFLWDGVAASDLVKHGELFPVPPGSGFNVSCFGEDALGEIHVGVYNRGEVWRIVAQGGAPDCDSDGIADGCAIALGLDYDQDQDGVPDSCQCPVAPNVYCTAKTDSLACPVQLVALGTPSASAPAPFRLRAQDLISSQTGYLLYGGTAAAAPFQGGTLCVGTPSTRSTVLFSFGTPPPAVDCSGVLELDFNALIQSGQSPYLAPGVRIHAQFAYRDPADPFGWGLTRAVEFDVCP